MSWFEELTGVVEENPEHVRRNLVIDGRRLRSLANGESWQFGELETPSLGELRGRVRRTARAPRPNQVREIVANVQHLHADPIHANAMFQVASQFNLLEMASPGITPDVGVGLYEDDHTQGPACAIAAGAGTIFRNYFVEIDGQRGQMAERQLDCLRDVGTLLGNHDGRLWQTTNGYALPSKDGLREVDEKLAFMKEVELDGLRKALRIGLQWGTQVTVGGGAHVVSQAYCSAMPVAYTRLPVLQWARFATLVLEAAYEATFCAGVLNAERTGDARLFLTLLGGGAFGNHPAWIIAAMRRAFELYHDAGLDIAIVSYGGSNESVRRLMEEYR